MSYVNGGINHFSRYTKNMIIRVQVENFLMTCVNPGIQSLLPCSLPSRDGCFTLLVGLLL